MKHLLNLMALPISYFHEGLHFVAARSLGVKARIYINATKRIARCEIWPEHDWQDVLITLAPMIGHVLLIVAIYFLWTALFSPLQVIDWLILVPASAGIMLGCARDLVDVWDLTRRRFGLTARR